jgi:regulator of sirC expression with transglutaminase-like and TPR domain
MSNTEKIAALIHLLDDSDREIFEHIRAELFQFGVEAIPQLESAWEQNDWGELFRERVEDLIHEIQFSNVSDALETWVKSGGKDLLTGVLLVNKYHYPDLNIREIKTALKRMADRVKSQLNPHDSVRSQLTTLNTVLFDDYHFRGDNDDYYSPNNSFLNKVIERKKGNPILLSVIYIELAKQLNINIVGVNLPRHFVVALKDDESGNFQYFLSPFNNGSLLMRADIEDYLKKINLPVEPKYYEECSNVAIVLRILLNLINSYTKTREKESLDEVSALYQRLSSLQKALD